MYGVISLLLAPKKFRHKSGQYNTSNSTGENPFSEVNYNGFQEAEAKKFHVDDQKNSPRTGVSTTKK